MLHSKYLLLFIAVGLCLGCNRNPYKSTNKIYKAQAKELAKTIRAVPVTDSLYTTTNWVGTINFNLRKPNFVVIHHTAQSSCAQTLQTFTKTASQVSAHYVICKEGEVYHMLNNYLRAWHGGVAKWGNITDMNSVSIGIELDNNGSEPFAQPQIKSLMKLLAELKKAYNIPQANFIGHADIAPARKVDPNIYFPWQQLANNGFGLWYGDTTNLKLPVGFNAMQTLKVIGYDVKDTTAAIRAFKQHYLKNTQPVLKEGDKKVLYALYKKL